MTREELHKILRQNASVPNPQLEGVLNAMVEVYNQALEDAAENADIHYPPGNNLNPTVDREGILKLKLDLRHFLPWGGNSL